MNIPLVNYIPEGDGYFLFKASPTATLHLVLLKTDNNGSRSLILDTLLKKPISIDINEVHMDFFAEALFSEFCVGEEIKK